MTIHVVCRDCRFEALVDDADADVTVETHEEETGHNVDDGRIDGGATVITDSGANTVEIDRGTLEELIEWGKARLERSGESPSTLADAVDAAEEALRVDDDETRLVTDGGRQPVEKMSVDELREEYRERADIGYSDPEDHDRKMALWNELRDRVDVEQPECPECGERNWGQAPGEPKKCNACGNPLDEPELAEDIQQAWNEIMRGDGNELVTDGGKPTLALTDDGLEIPEGINFSDGVVFRSRGATVDHKPGIEDRAFYPMIDIRDLRAEGRDAINEQLDEDEVAVKQYGEDAETYRVVIPETDGGTQNVDAWGIPSTREALLEHLRREVAESGLLRCKARRIADGTQLTTQTVGKYLSQFSGEESTGGVEVTVFHDRGVSTVYEIAPAEEVNADE